MSLPARPGYMACWVESLCKKRFWRKPSSLIYTDSLERGCSALGKLGNFTEKVAYKVSEIEVTKYGSLVVY
jgi:hypothetical protein